MGAGGGSSIGEMQTIKRTKARISFNFKCSIFVCCRLYLDWLGVNVIGQPKPAFLVQTGSYFKGEGGYMDCNEGFTQNMKQLCHNLYFGVTGLISYYSNEGWTWTYKCLDFGLGLAIKYVFNNFSLDHHLHPVCVWSFIR